MGKWKMTEYSVERLEQEINDQIIKVPKYQRGVVWNKTQKEKLIDSMNKGYPFGSILLYEKNNQFQIIDGLQRSTTIIEFVKNPAVFFADENMDDDIIDDLVFSLGIPGGHISEIKNKLIDLIKNWVVKANKTMLDVERMQYSDLVDEINNEWPTSFEQKQEIRILIQTMFEDFQNKCATISKMKIPALIYEGDESLLPEIFERINSQGAKLTKHQIYSATWAHDTVKLESSAFEEIILNNRDRYENMLDDSMALDDYDPIKLSQEKEVNIFELVFGFGKMISKKYPYLFNYDSNDKTKVESIGFNLINACLLQRSSNMNMLNKNMEKLIGLETNNIEDFLTKIIESIDYIDKRLGAGTKFKGNTRANSKVSPLHTEMQIVSIIATVFILRHASYKTSEKGDIYDLTITPGQFSERWSKNKKIFDKNILKIYSMDIFGQKWKGSGDKKLNSIIIDSFYYLREITWNEFEQNLDVYYNSMNSERNERKQVANPKEPEKLFLNLVYSQVFSAAEQNDETKYDIEHLAPKNLMKEKIAKYGEDFRLPISSIGNLSLLPEYDNRTKKDKTIYKDKNYLNKIKSITEIEQKYTFTKKEDFLWLEDDLTENEFKDKYFEFLNKRFVSFKSKIKDNMFTTNYREN